MKVPALLAAFVAGQLLAEDPRVTALIQQGDAADARHDPKSALVALRQAEGIEPQNFGVLLRTSKECADLIDSTRDEEAAKALGDKAIDYGRRALALDPRNAKAHLNLAVCYSKLTDAASNRLKVEYARLIHDEAQRSVELDPTDDYGWHVLGRWHATVANLNGVLKTLAGFMYGGLPAASNDEAAKCLKKAVELAPQRIMHHAELARTYTSLSKPDRAAQEWQNVLGIRPVDSRDEQYQKEAKLALESARSTRTPARGVARR